jgi:uncharacterized protein (TIGR00288 family)
MSEVSSLAVFVDFENLALGFKNRKDRFEIDRVLQRLVEKGKIIVKKGYADWSRFAEYKRALHEAGLELIEIPRRAMTGKNSADIHLVVDAMDLSYSKEHIDTFVIVSGDSDFSPVVSKLKENGKRVIGLGMRSSTSDLLVSSCDEFIFYEDLDDLPQAGELEEVPADKREVFVLLLETLAALQREVSGSTYASMVKDTMRRKQPSFLESNYGYRTFSELLEEARSLGIIELSTDERSGTYVVTRFKALPHKRTRRGGRRRSTKATTTKAVESSVKTSSDAKQGTTGERSTTRRKSTSSRKKSNRKASPQSASSNTPTPLRIDTVVESQPRRPSRPRRRVRPRPIGEPKP